MTIDKESIASFFNGMSGNNLNVIADILDDSCVLDFPKTKPLSTKKDVLRFLKILRYQYPELEFTIQKILLDGQFAAVHWKNKGFNRKSELYENEGVMILEWKNNKIFHLSEFFKNTENF
jgi:hypothetical protein